MSTNRVRPYGPVETTLTTDQLDHLHDTLHRVRDGTTQVKVGVDDLRALLKDYAALCSVITTTN